MSGSDRQSAFGNRQSDDVMRGIVVERRRSFAKTYDLRKRAETCALANDEGTLEKFDHAEARNVRLCKIGASAALGALAETVDSLRAKGWSDVSIARHLSINIELVRAYLEIGGRA